MMRIVIGSIEALSLKYMRHEFRYAPLPHITEQGTAFEPKERHKNTLKTGKQQAEKQMTYDSCVPSVRSDKAVKS